MATTKKPKTYVSLVNEKIGCDENGNPKIVFEVDKEITGLTAKQVKYYKSKNFIK